MKRKRRAFVFFLVLVFILVLFGYMPNANISPKRYQNDEIAVMTVNVRTSRLGILDFPNMWQVRRYLLARVILVENPDIIALQEPTEAQLVWLLKRFPQFALIRERSSDLSWEYPSLLIKRERFGLLSAERRWFSEEPTLPNSISYGNQNPRSFMTAKIRDRWNRKDLSVCSVHLDYLSESSRIKSIDDISQWVSNQKEPVVVMGDFNERHDSEPMAGLILHSRYGELFRGQLVDTHSAIDNEQGTLHGYDGEAKSRIDLILVTPDWTIKSSTINTYHKGRLYPSDHFPVTAVVKWPKVPQIARNPLKNTRL